MSPGPQNPSTLPRTLNLTIDKLMFWAKNKLNVMLVGRHGTGKTTLIKECFTEHMGWELGKDWLYFSGATLDPWVDLIGVPKKVILPDGKECLDLVRPRPFATQSIKAIFIDEYNRSHKKVKNACMELIQFKSINGLVFQDLQCVWVAVNPPESEGLTYDVDEIDPAQADRFHVKVMLPYRPDRSYFSRKFGEDIANIAISWWNAQTNEVRNVISPRCLDYCLEHYNRNGDLDEVLPQGANTKKLREDLSKTPRRTTMRNIFNMKSDNPEKAKQLAIEFLKDEDNWNDCIKEISAKKEMLAFFVPLMPDEKLSALITENPVVKNWCCNNFRDHDNINELLKNIIQANANITLVNDLKRLMTTTQARAIASVSSRQINPNAVKAYSIKMSDNLINPNYLGMCQQILNDERNSLTQYRTENYETIKKHIPEKMDTQQILQTLQVFEMFADRSHNKTLDSWNHFVPMINHCMKLLNDANYNFNGLTDKCQKLLRYCAGRKDFFFIL